MNPHKASSSNLTHSRSWVWISSILFLLCFLASSVLIFFGRELEELGITNIIYYIILIPLGFSSAAFLAGAMKSYASFKSNETLLYGKLNISGPIVIFVLVVGGGFIMPGLNRKEKFDVKMHIVSNDDAPGSINNGSVILYIGKYTRKENIYNSEVIFPEIPEWYNNKKGKIDLLLNDYQILYPQYIFITKNEDSIFNIQISKTKQSLYTNVRGSILNKKNEPVKNAFINFSSGLATCYTNVNGDFAVTLPIPPLQKVPMKISVNGITIFNQEQTISSSIPINLSLSINP